MTSVLAREDFRVHSREEFRARLMALILTAVLVWYTLVVPPYAPAPRRAGSLPEDEATDGEVRLAGGARVSTRDEDLKSESSDLNSSSDVPIEELDWPEYIGLD